MKNITKPKPLFYSGPQKIAHLLCKSSDEVLHLENIMHGLNLLLALAIRAWRIFSFTCLPAQNMSLNGINYSLLFSDMLLLLYVPC